MRGCWASIKYWNVLLPRLSTAAPEQACGLLNCQWHHSVTGSGSTETHRRPEQGQATSLTLSTSSHWGHKIKVSTTVSVFLCRTYKPWTDETRNKQDIIKSIWTQPNTLICCTLISFYLLCSVKWVRTFHPVENQSQMEAQTENWSIWTLWDLLDSKAIHEHDMIPKGSVDVQVDLFDLRRVQSGLLLHFLSTNKESTRTGWVIQSYMCLSKVAKILKCVGCVDYVDCSLV